jgi:hypothetical protein
VKLSWRLLKWRYWQRKDIITKNVKDPICNMVINYLLWSKLFLIEIYKRRTDSTSNSIPHISRSQNIWQSYTLCLFSVAFLIVYSQYSSYIHCIFYYSVVLEISKVQDLPANFPAVTIYN